VGNKSVKCPLAAYNMVANDPYRQATQSDLGHYWLY